MLKERARIVAVGLLIVDLALVVVAFFLSFWIRNDILPGLGLSPSDLYPLKLYLPLLPIVLIIWGSLSLSFHLYHSQRTASILVEMWDIVRVSIAGTLIGPEDGAPNFAMRRFIMGAGGGMPRHTNEVEHEQYVLQGRARIGIGERVVEVEAGDVVYIPARQPHFYEVLEAPFEFLCVVPNREDEIRLVDDGEQDAAE